MDHCAKDGTSKVKKACELPLTGRQVVDLIITDLAVFEVVKGEKLILKELAPGVHETDVRAKTEAHFTLAPDLIVHSA